jgi:ubiquitin carboxyl-terminal hydrolase 2/21
MQPDQPSNLRDILFQKPHNTKMSENGVVGLMNLGNTCYANSVLQVLRSIPAFSSQILSKKLKINEAADEKLKQFYDTFYNLVKQLWKNNRGTVVRPVHFLKSTAELVNGTIYEDFGRNMPNDAHEYYTFLLDKLQNATHTRFEEAQSTLSKADESWHQSFKKDYSKFVPLIYGQIKRTVVCRECKTENHSYEVFNSIKINLKDDNQPLLDSIIYNFKDEEIDEYRCNKCEAPRKAIIQQKIIKTPPYLSITINRFADGYGQGRKDVRTFNLENNDLDLSSIIEDDTNKQYSLMSTIDHHGTMRGGHYISCIKHVPSVVPSEMAADGPKPGQWYLYDDDTIHEIESPLISQSTYMLFLRRI